MVGFHEFTIFITRYIFSNINTFFQCRFMYLLTLFHGSDKQELVWILLFFKYLRHMYTIIDSLKYKNISMINYLVKFRSILDAMNRLSELLRRKQIIPLVSKTTSCFQCDPDNLIKSTQVLCSKLLCRRIIELGWWGKRKKNRSNYILFYQFFSPLLYDIISRLFIRIILQY